MSLRPLRTSQAYEQKQSNNNLSVSEFNLYSPTLFNCLFKCMPYAVMLSAATRGSSTTANNATANDSKSREVRLIHELVKARNTSVLKNVIRGTSWIVDDRIRSDVWPLLCSTLKKSRSRPEFDDEISGFIDKSPPDSPRKVPGFIDLTYCRHFNLDSQGQRDVEKVMWSLAREHPEVTYCPLLYPLSALFLNYINTKDTFESLSCLLELNNGSDSQPFLPQTKMQMAKDGYVLIKLTNKFGFIPPRNFCNDQRLKLNHDHEIDECFHDWTKWIFIGLPFKHLVRVVDCYLVEGMKLLFRVGLALLLLYKRANHQNGERLTLERMIAFCETIALTPNDLIKLATSLRRLSKVKIAKQYHVAEHDLHKHPQMVSHSMLPPISPFKTPTLSRRSDMLVIDNEKIHISTRMAPRNIKSNIIDWYLLDIIWDWIPERFIVHEPEVVFCTDEDGSSLKTFFSKCEPYEASILLIKTTKNEVSFLIISKNDYYMRSLCLDLWCFLFGIMGGKTRQRSQRCKQSILWNGRNFSIQSDAKSGILSLGGLSCV